MKNYLHASLVLPLLLIACGGSSTQCAIGDNDCDGVPDDLGVRVNDSAGAWGQIDFDGDGKGDGLAVDFDGDGGADGALIDTNGDGLGDALDTNGDNVADLVSGALPDDLGTGGGDLGPVGSGGASSGGSSSGGAGGGTPSGGAPSSGGSSTTGGCLLSSASPAPTTITSSQYFETTVNRGGVNYTFIANGWGTGWRSHTIKTTKQGTAYEIVSFDGSETGQGVPAGYPTVFCGTYSDKVSGKCGLDSPKAISSIISMQTGLKWSHAAGDGKYNIAYDVWLSNGNSSLSGYFMVWLRDPSGAQPAGGKKAANVTVAEVPGTWDVWEGSVNGHPIVNYVRPESSPSNELSFDIKDFFDHAQANGIALPGSSVISVAVGAEIWSGPVSNLKIEDFCVDVK